MKRYRETEGLVRWFSRWLMMDILPVLGLLLLMAWALGLISYRGWFA